MLRQRDTRTSSTLPLNTFNSLIISSICIINCAPLSLYLKRGKQGLIAYLFYSLQLKIINLYCPLPQQFLYFFPEPQEQSSFLPCLTSFLVGSFLIESS